MVLSRRTVEAPKAGEWLEELKMPRRRLLVHAVHQHATRPTHVEFLVEGRNSDRLSLALEVVLDTARFRRLGPSQHAA